MNRFLATAPRSTNELTPVAPPLLPTRDPAPPTNEPFFNSTNRFSRTTNETNNQLAAPAAPPASQIGFPPSNPPGVQSNRPNQHPFPSYGQPVDPFVADAPASGARDPFGRTVARPTTDPSVTTVAAPAGQFGPPLNQPPGPASYGPNGTGGVVQADLPVQQQGLPLQPSGNPNDPWMTTVMATLIALGSVGGNLFLGWSYLDARNKYRSALRRTSRTFGRVSNLADD